VADRKWKITGTERRVRFGEGSQGSVVPFFLENLLGAALGKIMIDGGGGEPSKIISKAPGEMRLKKITNSRSKIFCGGRKYWWRSWLHLKERRGTRASKSNQFYRHERA